MSEENDDLRSTLEAAMADEPEETVVVDEPEITAEPEAAPEETPGRERDDKGRFVAKALNDEPEVTVTETEVIADEVTVSTEASTETIIEEQPPEEPALAPPNGWSADAKAKWHELPEEVQSAVMKREQDAHKQISKHDDERNYGREMSKVVQPYLAQIQAEGGTPTAAVQSLLNTAYLLRTGTPDQKRQLILQTAEQFGVDLTQAPIDPNVSPEVAPLYQKINQLENRLLSADQQQATILQNEVHADIEAFAADSQHPHYESVKAHMAALLTQGAAEGLKDAYEQACWANPEVRATLQAQQKAEEEQKRKAEAKARADKAKGKDVSITGGPGNTSGKTAPDNRSLRDELSAQFEASSGAV